MKLFLIILLLISGFFACDNTKENTTISTEDIIDKKPDNGSITFYDTSHQVISPDKFNTLMAEGHYVFEQKFINNDTGEVLLVSILKHEKQLQSQKLPDFELIDLEGNTFTQDKCVGKVTVLSFWFSSSVICSYEISKINNFISKHPSREKIQLLAPSLDNTVDLSRFLKGKSWNYAFAVEQENLAKQFGITTYPTHIIIDQNGKIVKAIVQNPKCIEILNQTLDVLLQDNGIKS